jgi:NitT/TauT family transport system permease protein
MLLGAPARRSEIIRRAGQCLTPNEDLSLRAGSLIIAVWVFLLLAWWQAAKPDIFPSPLDVLAAFPALWSQGGLGQELISSLTVNWEALFWSSLISLPLAYLSRTPAIKPLAQGVAKLRFVSPAVFYVILLYLASNGHEVKVLMLTLGETFFLVTTMIGVVQNIPDYQFDDCRTLRMSEWKGTWYVLVRGTLTQAIDAIRDNAAMGWSMLLMVEGVVRSEGGVGVMVLNQEKHQNFAEVYAIAIAIVLVGITQDYIIGAVKRVVCPYAA